MMLQRRELLREGEALSNDIGKAFVEARSGERFEGKITRSVDLASGKFAVVEKALEFTLVPWRPMLERRIGQSASGIIRGDGVNWSFGRARAGPQIS